MITFHVEDLLIAEYTIKIIHSMSSEISKPFETEDYDKAQRCLGLWIAR